MKTYAPNYYKAFHCIADRCRHSCCVGWDIYIDDDTVELYRDAKDSFGKNIVNNLCQTDDGYCFKMDKNRRCPFLNQRGLCDIITAKGEGYLCEICREHPRFYNSFSDRWEMGIGLSCEEAARIILSQKEVTELEIISEDDLEELELWEDEAYVLQKRNEIINILQNRDLTIEGRVQLILDNRGIVFPDYSPRAWADIFDGLERLDEAWGDVLLMLKEHDSNSPLPELETAFEKLLVYFIYRHVSIPCDEQELNARIVFSLLGYKIIKLLCIGEKAVNGSCSFEKLCDFVRMYSSEIEYSDENTGFLINFLASYQENANSSVDKDNR